MMQLFRKKPFSRHTVIAVVLVTTVLTGCQHLGELSEVGTALGVLTGTISEKEAASINRSAQAVEKSFEDITPEQEYFIGRAVGAVILDTYVPYTEAEAREYIHLLGTTLSLYSEKPETFSGYHFLILDTDEINAFAAPSGFIFVSRGLLALAENEDMVAAVLAHEIAHAELSHGLKAIKKSRLTTALTSVAITAVETAGSQELQKITGVFGDSITDITSTMINSGYSLAFETEADAAAVRILLRAGYDPFSLVTLLEKMDERLKGDKRGFGKTHPDPKERIKKLTTVRNAPLADMEPVNIPDERIRRFERLEKVL